MVPWWRSPSRKCHQGPSAHASLLSPLLLAASPRPFPSCSLQVKRLCSRHSSLPPWSASLLHIQPLSLSLSPLSLSLSFFSLSPFLCLSLPPPPLPCPPTLSPRSPFGNFSPNIPTLPHHAQHFGQCLPSGWAWAHFHEGDDPTWAPLTL